MGSTCCIQDQDKGSEVIIDKPNNESNRSRLVSSSTSGTPTVIKRCFECNDLNEDSVIIPLNCKKCFIDSDCLFNKIQKDLGQFLDISIYCPCNLPISYSLYEEYVSTDILMTLITVISKSSKHLKVFNCSCGNILKSKTIETVRCSCGLELCSKCLQSHNLNISCLNHYCNAHNVCQTCKRKMNRLDCGCFLCKTCSLEQVQDQILQNSIKGAICPKCSKNLTDNSLNLIFNGQSNYIKFLKSAENVFQCPICYKTKPKDSNISIPCGHLHCQDCLQKYIKDSADGLSENSASIHCPTCQNEIDVETIKDNLTGNVLKRYLVKLRKCLEKTENLERKKYCADCDFEFNVRKNRKKHKCPNCKRQICSNCYSIYSKDCCASDQHLDLELLGEMKDLICQCPLCKAPVMKNDPGSIKNGCNFLKCTNNKCSQGYFCFLCHKILTVRDI